MISANSQIHKGPFFLVVVVEEMAYCLLGEFPPPSLHREFFQHRRMHGTIWIHHGCLAIFVGDYTLFWRPNYFNPM